MKSASVPGPTYTASKSTPPGGSAFASYAACAESRGDHLGFGKAKAYNELPPATTKVLLSVQLIRNRAVVHFANGLVPER
jgi:hypothetical protein